MSANALEAFKSAALGVGSPLEWLCAITTPAAPKRSASSMMVRIGKLMPSVSPASNCSTPRNCLCSSVYKTAICSTSAPENIGSNSCKASAADVIINPASPPVVEPGARWRRGRSRCEDRTALPTRSAPAPQPPAWGPPWHGQRTACSCAFSLWGSYRFMLHQFANALFEPGVVVALKPRAASLNLSD